ncbi:flagellin-specific chaperone FliS [Acinetobacter lwoffii]|jgi:flagellin-specific chaperone FliS|uniref:Flagellin-specific chaperone FliS n=1 Tax=Acinetobacter lwoffii TaxID=28090 RepID=A0AAW8LNY5_ACILW|nr:hypothetical protein [Acinetobacter lwoffii]MDR6630432.1 flagellin-specific chaperone FliS [Acinetobacter lwoffii]
MSKEMDLNTGISKRHDTDLWKEIRTCYESRSQPPYDKIKDLLCAEFNLDKFPSKSTVHRRATKEKWERFESEDTLRVAPNKYSDDLWLCIRSIYEANPKLSYKRLKEQVQNELQCNDFPSQQSIAIKAEHEGWQRADLLIKKSDTVLKKMSRSVNKLTSEQDFKNFIASINTEEEQDHEHGELDTRAYDFDFIAEIVENEKSNIKNLLMGSQVRRKKQAEVIVKARKRMELNNDFGDRLSDNLIMVYSLLLSDAVRRNFTKPMIKELKDQLNALREVSAIYSDLSFNKRENIKFQLSLYGVQMEDLKDVDDAKRVNDLNDNTAYDAQRERLAAERERIAARRRYIDSGGLQEDTDAEMERRMAEADSGITDVEFEEME